MQPGILSRGPNLALRPYVECIWHYSSRTRLEGRDRVLPDGHFHLMLNLESGMGTLAGLRSHHVVVDTAQVSSVIGVVFRPGATRAFFAPPAVEFCDRAVRLDLVWDRAAEAQLFAQLGETELADRRMSIVETALIERIQKFWSQHVPIDPVVHYALQAFSKTADIRAVADVSREVGWSRRWFTQVFAENVGMTPKRYCRLLRFQDVVRQIASQDSVNWAEVSLAGGFCDQAHLVHEFRAFSGLTPQIFFSSDRPHPNHVRIAS